MTKQLKKKPFCKYLKECQISLLVTDLSSLLYLSIKQLKHLYLFLHNNECLYGEQCRNLLNIEHCINYHLHILAVDELRKRNVFTLNTKKKIFIYTQYVPLPCIHCTFNLPGVYIDDTHCINYNRKTENEVIHRLEPNINVEENIDKKRDNIEEGINK
jgi:hypothetical protein